MLISLPSMRSIITASLVAGGVLAVVTPLPVIAAPLLMEGKETLYQRVLTTPGAKLYTAPSAEAEGAKDVQAFAAYYVYERKAAAGRKWVKVGISTDDKTAGWIPAKKTIPWKQQIALFFANTAGRSRNVLFRTEEALKNAWKQEKPADYVAGLRDKAIANETVEDVVAVEPKEYVNAQDPDNFYLLPILSFSDQATNDPAALVTRLEVASITKPTAEGNTNNTRGRRLREFNAAVVFVIDTTISMGPYIDTTRKLVETFYETIEASDIKHKIKFGLVGYRSNVDKAPGLEYDAKLFADPNTVSDGKDFLAKMKNLTPATVSSPLFDEDAYAGIKTALTKIDWSGFGARHIILVTDAGAIDGENPLSATGLSAAEIRQQAKEKGVALYAMHMKTGAGVKNHGSAEAQYKELADNPYTQELYYEVKQGDEAEYAKSIKILAETFLKQVELASQGKEAAGSAVTATANTDAPTDDPLEQLRRDAALMGHAMQLAYLGRTENTRAPEFFRAWLSDADFADPQRQTVETRVLLTRKQLNNLHLVLSELLRELERGQGEDALSAEDFFDSLRSVAAKIGRDPSQITDNSPSQLGGAGLFDEYLDDLPYKSDLMLLDFDAWSEKGPSERDKVLDNIRRKLRQYSLMNEDSSRWVQLTPGAPAGDVVYPVPLETMP